MGCLRLEREVLVVVVVEDLVVVGGAAGGGVGRAVCSGASVDERRGLRRTGRIDVG